MKSWANTFEIQSQYLTMAIIASAYCIDQRVITLHERVVHTVPCSVDWSADWALLWFINITPVLTSMECPLSNTLRTVNRGSDKLSQKWLAMIKCTNRFPDAFAKEQVSTPGTILWAPWWVPMLCVSCVDQGDELIPLMLPILCRYPWPPWWAPRSLYLNPADSNKHIHCCCPLHNRCCSFFNYRSSVSWEHRMDYNKEIRQVLKGTHKSSEANSTDFC